MSRKSPPDVWRPELGSREMAAQAEAGQVADSGPAAVLTDSRQLPSRHRCFTEEGEWVECEDYLCEASFLLREYEWAGSEARLFRDDVLPTMTRAADRVVNAWEHLSASTDDFTPDSAWAEVLDDAIDGLRAALAAARGKDSPDE